MSHVSYLASPSATRAVLERHGLATKKALGQNFLVNDSVIARICELSEVCADDAVLEVGPGIGTLTVALLARAGRVLSVERDTDLPAVLAETCADFDNFTLLSKDALTLSQADLDEAFGEAAAQGEAPNKFVANLPYAVAATLVLDFFQRFSSLQCATVMVQSEVADRMMAKMGTKDYGAYTVKLNLIAKPTGRFQVGPGNFFPPPRVTSAVIRLDRRDDLGITAEEAAVASLMADAAFATRRKTIANSMKTFFSGRKGCDGVVEKLPAILEGAGIDARRRGESLTLEEFIGLGAAYTEATR
ncbi:16S rRNA (adenine(1518)-N(6)/adenine(1519)-N(6))-dimethyltransferase RsmA [uncultured Slackia sp.]|uniref:16S rRNA (adenine(1518)-N(6)/adenine(1519)-N(6))- dimethyltransferase RsmA n=1 Tax=uncultured Slackia sp. TaxID=665903 RepID=UPI0026E010BD|nr:16S rRNA (adenine(1518)-N(6)/adenine(1519)-N(6))-dimethyltransferase RsmA [uncultured Slackia sp.]